MVQRMRGGQRTNCRETVLSPTRWVLTVKLRSSRTLSTEPAQQPQALYILWGQSIVQAQLMVL